MVKKYKFFPKIVFIMLTVFCLNSNKDKAEELVLSDTSLDQLIFPEVVFVDWDNTLTNSWPHLLKVMNKTLTTFGKKPLTMDEYRNLPNVNMPQAEVIKAIFGEERPDVVNAYWQNYQEEHLKSALIIDEFAKEFFEFLKASNVFVAIVSNQEQEVLEKNVTKSGLRKYVDKVVGAIRGEPQKNKPMVGSIQRALQGSYFLKNLEGKVHDNWWFVGDGDTDIKTALNSASFPVWVTQYAISRIKFVDTLAAPKGLRVQSLQDLLVLLKKIKLNANKSQKM